MTLKSTKSVMLSGSSEIDGQQVIYLSANVTTENAGNTTINLSVQNQELYKANKEECRKDIDEFTKKVREIEDTI
ncbi:hypothetical protein [Enterococcus sp. AZ109]|uniref:hypothetical protein n=1 Tax=Enterococcus sp. AZ109 TaxID=2774634 RepID=UPI003F2681CF